MRKSRFLQILCGIVWILLGYGSVLAGQPNSQHWQSPEDKIAQAKKLEEAGLKQQAFALYIKIPNAEHLALRIAQTDPKGYLELLRSIESEPGSRPDPRLWLIQGELLFKLGSSKEALTCYKTFTASLDQTVLQTWDERELPRPYYPVSPQVIGIHGNLSGSTSGSPGLENSFFTLKPFHYGPGSQADNLLLQRFLSLGDWDEAAKEFERIWKIHQFVALEGQLFGPGLQFALEYAFFLTKYQQRNRGLDILVNALLRVNLDRYPETIYSPYSPIAKNPEIQAWRDRMTINSDDLLYLTRPAWFTQPLFIRLVYGQFSLLGLTATLKQVLESQIQAGNFKMRRVLARIVQLEGKEDEAIALELEYLRQAGFNPLTVAFRSGLIYERYNRLPEAISQFEQCLKLPKQPLSMPDPEEDKWQEQRFPKDRSDYGYREGFYPNGILKHLFFAYSTLGEVENTLRVGLQLLENKAILRDLEFDQICNLFVIAGKQTELTTWIRTHAELYADYPLRRASLAWLSDDPKTVIDVLVSLAKIQRLDEYQFTRWEALISSQKKEWHRPFLEAIVAADPDNAKFRRALDSIKSDTTSVGNRATSSDNKVTPQTGIPGRLSTSQPRPPGQTSPINRPSAQIQHKTPPPIEPQPKVDNPCGQPITSAFVQQLIGNPNQEKREDCFKALGEAVSKNPQLLQLLLNSQPPDCCSRFESYDEFLKRIFIRTDKSIVPTIHQALASPNMLVRRNAAYACAGLKDPASIPLLIQALQTESSLVRAGVIWALGELKAKAAIPTLMKMYREGAGIESWMKFGFRTDELNRGLERQYQKLNTNTPLLAHPQADYYDHDACRLRWLLRPEDFDRAFLAIGLETVQPYVRFQLQQESAFAMDLRINHLEKCPPSEVEQTKGILRCIAAKDSVEAAVGLLLLGDKTIEPVIVQWLQQIKRYPVHRLVALLHFRVRDRSKLAFARPILAQYVANPSLSPETRGYAQMILEE
ncbi:MAG: HEAT repeat domain-containing protein [Acidobacteria bacterium]|nr:HEAT repeat domain-containing protein [Acidobacteriota bacterium]